MDVLWWVLIDRTVHHLSVLAIRCFSLGVDWAFRRLKCAASPPRPPLHGLPSTRSFTFFSPWAMPGWSYKILGIENYRYASVCIAWSHSLTVKKHSWVLEFWDRRRAGWSRSENQSRSETNIWDRKIRKPKFGFLFYFIILILIKWIMITGSI